MLIFTWSSPGAPNLGTPQRRIMVYYPQPGNTELGNTAAAFPF